MAIIHLAIPCADLAVTRRFYGEILGMTIGRSYNDRISVNFFGAQLVCHLAPDHIDTHVSAYPRHFGLTFTSEQAFDAFHDRLQQHEVTFLSSSTVRFAGKKEAHKTFFILDPSQNVLEFKYYFDQSQNY